MNVEKVDIVRLELLEGVLDGGVEIFPMVASVVYDLALPKFVAAIIRGISEVGFNGLRHLFTKGFR